MKIKIEDFFKPVHVKDDFSKDDYEIVEAFINFARSLSRLTYQSIYLIDYSKKSFLFVSDNPIFLCGSSPEKVLKEGYQHYLDNVPKDDLLLIKKANDVGFAFFGNLDTKDRLKFSISYDFHLKQPGSKPLLINHKLKPLLLDKHSNPWIALCLVSISSHANPGNIKFKSDEDGKQFEYDLDKDVWVETLRVKLKPREKDILLFSAQGLTMDQIADRLYVSIDTVKFHKKQIFSKLKVKSITEATALAIELSLF
ncbi:helix-turn-helix transcriptional regulator [Sphingobacterium sp. N143]|uniref:response regulator transcription factor n=1 Tax=Sphingobacterium sp. N143 TaxID=2746727 RepID=UPI0025757609|nr:LuxR family transcriptional regulator [Sphingobacterium sp. N143]MDM1294228.1 helix-turn-helix transcriptional regulator [Sphingobacterium sp. N143]